MLKHRKQKSWPQSSETGSRSRSRQMEQAGSSRGAAVRGPRPSSSLGKAAWDLGVRSEQDSPCVGGRDLTWLGGVGVGPLVPAQ